MSSTYHIAVGRLTVGHGSKATQTILVHIDPQGVTGGHQHVDTQVKLEAINDEGLCANTPSDRLPCTPHDGTNQTNLRYVLLTDHVLPCLDILGGIRQPLN